MNRISKANKTIRELKDRIANFSTQTVSFQEAMSVGMKYVRAKPGNLQISDQVSSKRHKSGRLVDIISLNYCTLPGLLHLGVVPMPKDLYSCHLLMKDLDSRYYAYKNDKKRPIAQISGKLHATSSIKPKKLKITKLVELDDEIVSKDVSSYDYYDMT